MERKEDMGDVKLKRWRRGCGGRRSVCMLGLLSMCSCQSLAFPPVDGQAGAGLELGTVAGIMGTHETGC